MRRETISAKAAPAGQTIRQQRPKPVAKKKKAPTVVPTTEKAAAIDRFGPPEALTLHTIPVPDLAPNEVLVAIQYAGVGYWDARIRDGSWAEKDVRFPLVPGTDGAGFVVKKGGRVRRIEVGDRVWAYAYQNPKGGFYAEYVAVRADNVARVPETLDLRQAGAGSVTGLTALQGIDTILHVRKGDTVLIFGASGAVGTLALQFAKCRQARVIGTASGSDAASLVRQLGADEVIDPRSGDAMERLRTLAPQGIDAVLALAGGETLERCIDLVKAGGRVAYPNGIEPEPAKRKDIEVQAYDGMAGPREFQRLERAVAEARLRIPVAASFPLAQAAKAHARLEQGHVLGRIVLEMSGA